MAKSLRAHLQRVKVKKKDLRLFLALGCYGALVLTALWGLLPVRDAHDGFVLGLVLFFFAWLIVRTLAHAGEQG